MTEPMNNEISLPTGFALDLAEFVEAYIAARLDHEQEKDKPDNFDLHDEVTTAMTIYGNYSTAIATASFGGFNQLTQMAALGAPKAEPEDVETPSTKTTSAEIHNHLVKLSGGGKIFIGQDKKNPHVLSVHTITEDGNGRTVERNFHIHPETKDYKP